MIRNNKKIIIYINTLEIEYFFIGEKEKLGSDLLIACE